MFPPLLLFAFANERQENAHYLRALSDECRAIEAALDPAVRAGLCEVKILSNATIDSIFSTFQDTRYRDRIALFHYGGHAGSFGLLLEENDRQNAIAHPEGLVSFLGKQTSLQLVFLNGCSTEKWALELNNVGVPLVIGTFEAISDEVAQRLAAQFYAGLGQGLPLRRAWNESIDRIQTDKQRGDLRGFGRAGQYLDRFPWDIFQRKGTEKSDYWNLPDSTGNPLAALPLPAGRYKFPNEPYRFLDRYKKEDAPVFFGRGQAIRDLYDRLTNPVGSPVILLSGQSGVGKSSLLEAGLSPRLEARHTVIYLRRDVAGLTPTLLHHLNGLCGLEAVGKSLADCWKSLENRHNQPITCILDQAEEAYTREGGQGDTELHALVKALGELFADADVRPQSKILIGFRKEYELEIKDIFRNQNIAFELVPLRKLTWPEILEVVKGLASTPDLIQKYGLRIESGLPEAIAADLLADSDTPVAPVLQIILTKLWQGLPDGEERVFTQSKYLQLKEDGIFLSDFFRQQMAELAEWSQKLGKDIAHSGLALDVLNTHTTDLGFANSQSLERLKDLYQHRSDVLETLLKKFKELYLLTDAGPQRSALAHDTLAPVVHQEMKSSDLPGQKALRILLGKTANYNRHSTTTFIDEEDLTLVELGRTGMRGLIEKEPDLIKKSKDRRTKLRRQRYLAWSGLALLGLLAAWFGYVNYQKGQIEQWVSRARVEAGTDPTLAMHTLENAIQLAPDNPAVLAALADIYSDNEFYERVFQHPDPVKGVFLAPDTSGVLYSWTEKGLYRWTRRGERQEFPAPAPIEAAALSPDGQMIALSMQDGHLVCVQALTLRQQRQEMPFGERYATHLAFSTDGNTLFVAGADTCVYGLSVNNLVVATRFPVHETVSNLTVHPYHHTLLIGYVKGKAEERSASGLLLDTFPGHTDQVLSFAVSPQDSTSIVTVDRDAKLLFRDANGNITLTIKGHDRRINAIAWAAGNNRLFSISNDHLTKTWSSSGDLIAVYRGHSGFVNGLAVSADGQYFATAGEDKTVRWWKTESKVLRRFGPHPNGVSGIGLSKDGRLVVTAADAGANMLGEIMNDPNTPQWLIAELFFGTGSKPSSVRSWEATMGSLRQEMKGHRGSISSLAFSPTDARILTTSDDSTAIVWKNENGRYSPERPVPFRHQERVRQGAFSPDGQFVLTGGADSLANVWNLNNTHPPLAIKHPAAVSCVAFMPGNQGILTGCYDGVVRWFDGTGKPLREVNDQTGQLIECIAISPDGQFLLVGGRSDTLRLWNLTNQALVNIPVAIENKTGASAILSVTFSADGAQFAVGAQGGVALVFQMVGSTPILTRSLRHYPRYSINAVVFTPDGQGLLTGSSDGWGRWWEL